MEKASKKRLPLGYWWCAFTNVFECLSYYLGRSMILVFVTAAVVNGGLGLTNADGAKMQSALTSLTYLIPLFGGFIVDRLIGARYTTPIGMAIMGIGYFVGAQATGTGGIYAMIFIISIGLSLFKVGPVAGRVVKAKDPKMLDSAFSVMYSVSNLGSFLGPFFVGILYKDVFARGEVYGFAACWRLAGIVMIAGALFFVLGWRFMGVAGKYPFKMEKTAEELEQEAKEKAALKEARKQPLSALEKRRIVAILLVTVFAGVFWIFWYLAYLPVYYHWSDNMNWVILGYEVPLTWFDSINALLCVIGGPLTAKLWMHLASRPKGDMSLFRKTSIGLGFLGVGYLFFAILEIARGNSLPSALWLLIVLFLLTAGEMFFSPLGSSFITKYAPPQFYAFLMTVWGFGIFIGAALYAYVYEFAFEGSFSFTAGSIGCAVVAFLVAAALFLGDKKMSRLIDEN